MTEDVKENKEMETLKSTLNSEDNVKADLIFKLFLAGTKLKDNELQKISNLDADVLSQIRTAFEKHRFGKEHESDAPYSWDYILAFNVGNDDMYFPNTADKKRKEEGKEEDHQEWLDGMPLKKFYAQIMEDFRVRLEYARLSTKTYRSGDGLYMYIAVGITEQNIRFWADKRDADLKLDPDGAVEVGNNMRYPLAMRTHKGQLPKKLWENLYCEYSPKAEESIYTKYERVKGNADLLTPFDTKTRLRIIYESITADQGEGGAEIMVENHVLDRKHPMVACFPLHDPEMLDWFNNNWIKPCKITHWGWAPLMEIRDYFGEPVAFYFGFLTQYMRWLVWPSVAGVVFFTMQIIGGHDPEPGRPDLRPKFDVQYARFSAIPLMGFFIIFWSVAFVDFWLREEARLRWIWGMTGYNDKAVARPQFKGEWLPDAVTGMYSEQFSLVKRIIRQIVVFFFLGILLLMSLVAVIGVLVLKDTDPDSVALKIGLGVANGVTITIFNIIYGLVAHYGNEFENHRTTQDYENMLIIKGFFFKFINSFSSLFYLAFIRPFNLKEEFYVRNYKKVCWYADAAVDIWLRDTGRTTMKTEFTNLASTGCGYTQDVRANPSKYEKGLCRSVVSKVSVWNIAYQGWESTGNSTACTGNAGWGTDVTNRISVSSTVSGVKCGGICSSDVVIKQWNEAVLNEVFFQLVSLFGTALIVQNSLEVGCPILCDKLKGDIRAKTAIKEGREVLPESEVEEQARMGVYNSTIDDMTEMIVQFGYVTLFVMAFPLTPLLAFLNNVLEMKVDAINLVRQSQRPHPIGSYGLGSWNLVLAFFSLVSVFANVMMITFRTGLINIVFQDQPGAQWIFFSILTICLLIIVGLEKVLIPDVPAAVIEALARQREVENVLAKEAAIEEFEEEPPGDGDEDDDGVFDFNPNANYTDAAGLDVIPERDLQFGASPSKQEP